MNIKENDYYVYVYIDPRNHQEFYYGKGKGARKLAHLDAENDRPEAQRSEKGKRIQKIFDEDLKPIIRVVACNLTSQEALLVESTLIWKLGQSLLNLASGYYADHFRPVDKLHVDLPRFDFARGLYYYNVGEGHTRNWEDYRAYQFISAGGKKAYRNSMLGFNMGDIFVAYLKNHGFVGIGEIVSTAVPIRQFTHNGKPLLALPLKAETMDQYCDDDDMCEYVCAVRWLADVDREDAIWESNSGLYTTTWVRASLENQATTISHLSDAFGIDLLELLNSSESELAAIEDDVNEALAKARTASDLQAMPASPIVIPFAKHYSQGDFEKLRKGFIPSMMEDRWFMYFSRLTLFIHRGFGECFYKIEFAQRENGYIVSEAFANPEISFDDDGHRNNLRFAFNTLEESNGLEALTEQLG